MKYKLQQSLAEEYQKGYAEGKNKVYAQLCEVLNYVCEVLNYEKNKLKIKKSGNVVDGNLLNQGCGSIGSIRYMEWEEEENKENFVKRFMVEEKERKRLMLLYEEVEKGRQIKNEK